MTGKKRLLLVAILFTTTTFGYAQGRSAVYQAVEKDLIASMHFTPDRARTAAGVMEAYSEKAKAASAAKDDEEDKKSRALKGIRTEAQEKMDARMEQSEKMRLLRNERNRKLQEFLTRDQIAQAEYVEMKQLMIASDGRKGRK